MDVYYKPTIAHRCLPFYSNHPKHCKKEIPFTLARHICTIVENTEAKMKHLENLKMNLKLAIFHQNFIFSSNDSTLKTMKNAFYFI